MSFDPIAKKLNRRSLLGEATMILLINLAATVVAVWLQILKSGWQNFTQKDLLASFVYSNVIGTLIALTTIHCVPLFAHRSFLVRWIFLLLDIFFVTYIGGLLTGGLLTLIGVFPPGSRFWLNPANMTFSLLIALVFGISAGLYEAVRTKLTLTTSRLQRVELERERAQRHATEASLASLESRLHPHFLFNTLNSIATLIREDADLAEKTVEQLARLLRYSLDANCNRLIALSQELKITRDYLEIERVRFGERLSFTINVDPKFSRVEVPPFSLQTLVENSIKHVAAKRPGKIEIEITAVQTNQFLTIEVFDDGDGFSAANLKNDHGLDNLQKRLATIFDDQTALEIGGNSNLGGRVAFRVPFKEENATETARLFN